MRMQLFVISGSAEEKEILGDETGIMSLAQLSDSFFNSPYV